MIEISVNGWLREGAGYTEDGHHPVVEDFIVWATLPDGRRFQHKHVFAGRVVFSDEDGFAFGLAGDKAAAERFAARIERALDRGVELDGAYWEAIRPAYGSQAYQDGDWSARDLAWERSRP